MKTLTSRQATLLAFNDSELTTLMVCWGLITKEEVETASTQYRSFLGELDREWPPNRVKDWVINFKRERFKRVATNLQNTEFENSNQRVKGISYSQRKRNNDKLKFGIKYLNRLKKDGLEAQKGTYNVSNIVQPMDVPTILEKGLEPILLAHFS